MEGVGGTEGHSKNQDVNGGRRLRGIRNQPMPDARPFSLRQPAQAVTLLLSRDDFLDAWSMILFVIVRCISQMVGGYCCSNTFSSLFSSFLGIFFFFFFFFD